MGVVIVGASVGGVNTAAGLRSFGYSGAITLVDAEDALPYDKPPLSKHALEDGWSSERALLRPADYYADEQIELRLGVAATGLEAQPDGGAAVHLADGETLRGDAVVLAPGVRARWLPGEPSRKGVWTIRSASDSDGLRTELAAGARVVVVGGGFIGAEAAGMAAGRGCEVTIVEMAAVPFAHLFGDDIGRALTRRHQTRGIKVLSGAGVMRLEGSERVERVVLADGAVLDADVVLLGLGAVPATEWLDGAVELDDGGIVADQQGRTSTPGVYAVGDAAAWWDPSVERHRRVEHWTTAKEQAAAVARAIACPGEPLREVGPVAYFWSDQHGARLQFLGESAPNDEVHVVSGSLEAEQFVALFSREGRLVGALGLADARTLMTYRQHLVSRAKVAPLLAAAAAAV